MAGKSPRALSLSNIGASSATRPTLPRFRDCRLSDRPFRGGDGGDRVGGAEDAHVWRGIDGGVLVQVIGRVKGVPMGRTPLCRVLTQMVATPGSALVGEERPLYAIGLVVYRQKHPPLAQVVPVGIVDYVAALHNVFGIPVEA